jgi:hypothetical protein
MTNAGLAGDSSFFNLIPDPIPKLHIPGKKTKILLRPFSVRRLVQRVGNRRSGRQWNAVIKSIKHIGLLSGLDFSRDIDSTHGRTYGPRRRATLGRAPGLHHVTLGLGVRDIFSGSRTLCTRNTFGNYTEQCFSLAPPRQPFLDILIEARRNSSGGAPA